MHQAERFFHSVVGPRPSGQESFTPVPNHPYASYRVHGGQRGIFWIECYCRLCGERPKKQCRRPQLWQRRVLEFAVMHGHGHRPVVR